MNVDIEAFEVQVEADIVDKWAKQMEGYICLYEANSG